MKNFTEQAFQDPMQEIIDQYASAAETKDKEAEAKRKNETKLAAAQNATKSVLSNDD